MGLINELRKLDPEHQADADAARERGHLSQGAKAGCFHLIKADAEWRSKLPEELAKWNMELVEIIEDPIRRQLFRLTPENCLALIRVKFLDRKNEIYLFEYAKV